MDKSLEGQSGASGRTAIGRRHFEHTPTAGAVNTIANGAVRGRSE